MKNKTEEKKKFSPFKKLMILLIVILLIFGIWNLSWYVLAFRPCEKMAEKLNLINVGGGDDDELQRYFLEKDGYSFTVFPPSYLWFSRGTCRVSSYSNYENYVDLDEETERDPDEIVGYDLYYYPAIFGEDDYGFFIDKYDGSFTAMHVSKDLEFVNVPEEELTKDEIEEDKKLLKEHHDELEKLMEQKIEMWG